MASKMKKALCLVLAMALLFAFASCGKKETSDDTETKDDPKVNEEVKVDNEEKDKDEEEAPKSSLKEKYNILLMGTDAGGRLTDVLMVYHFDTKEKTVRMVSIPRDTKITLNGSTQKINAAHNYGKKFKNENGGDRSHEYAINAVSELTGISIDHYICIDLKAFRQIIDALGGFDFEVARNMDYDDSYQNLHIHLKKGMQHMDGDKAEQLVRFRKYSNGDIGRVQVQQQVLKALVNQKLNLEYADKVPEILDIISDNMETDLAAADFVSIVASAIEAVENSGGIETHILDGSAKYIGKVSYYIADTGKIAKVAGLFETNIE